MRCHTHIGVGSRLIYPPQIIARAHELCVFSFFFVCCLSVGGYCFNTNSNGNNGGGNAGGMPTGHDDMDDILIVTSRQSEPAILWANYLKQRFDKITKQRGRKPFK